ncbi:MAG: hypothetical protein B6U95_07070 [Thermofilum sp. ex4484_82]|nr:MAG: hypothetical protein B6U95_07070 [Thermofilum sp. ex4484_82]OYT37280.1 MAG: hypothetical protein B6U96_07065 [Archaeoglobales archaeon ex4484_92]
MKVAWIGGYFFGKSLLFHTDAGLTIQYYSSIKELIKDLHKNIDLDVLLFLMDASKIEEKNFYNIIYSYCLDRGCGLFIHGGWGYPKALIDSKLYEIFPVKFLNSISNNLTHPEFNLNTSFPSFVDFNSFTEVGGFTKTIAKKNSEVVLTSYEYGKNYPILVLNREEIPIIYYASDFMGWGKHLIHWNHLDEFFLGVIRWITGERLNTGIKNSYHARSSQDILPRNIFEGKWYLKNKEKLPDRLFAFVNKLFPKIKNAPPFVADALQEYVFLAGYLYESMQKWRKAALTHLLTYHLGEVKTPLPDLFMRGKIHYLFARSYLNKSLTKTAEHLYKAYHSYLESLRYLDSKTAKLSAKEIGKFYLGLSEVVRGIHEIQYSFSKGTNLIKKGIIRLLKVGASPYGHGFAKKIYEKRKLFATLIALLDFFLLMNKITPRSVRVRIPMDELTGYLLRNLILQRYTSEIKYSYTTAAFVSSIKEIKIPTLISIIKSVSSKQKQKQRSEYNTLILRSLNNEKLHVDLISEEKHLYGNILYSKKLLNLKNDLAGIFLLLKNENEDVSMVQEKIVDLASKLFSILPKNIRKTLEDLPSDDLLILTSGDVPPFEYSYIDRDDIFLDLKFSVSKLQSSVSYILKKSLFPQRKYPLKGLVIRSQILSPKYSQEEIEAISKHLKLQEIKLKNIEATPMNQILNIMSYFSTAESDIIHYVGHGSLLEEKNIPFLVTSKNQGLLGKITPGFFINFTKTPLLFFNACFSGYEGSSEHQISNFAAASIDAEAGGFIGPSHIISSKFAVKFASKFYEELNKQRNKPIVKILKDTKQYFWKNNQIAWISYRYFGHPKFHL